MLLGYARVSKADGQDTGPQIEALEAAGCQRIYEEHISGGRWVSRIALSDGVAIAEFDGLPGSGSGGL